MYYQSSFLAYDSESIAVWCMYLGSWILQAYGSILCIKIKSKLINEENSWYIKWSQHQFHLRKTHKSTLSFMTSFDVSLGPLAKRNVEIYVAE